MQHASTQLTQSTRLFINQLNECELARLDRGYAQHLDSIGFEYPPTQALPFFAPQSWRDRCRIIGKEIFTQLEMYAQRFPSAEHPQLWCIPKHLIPVVHQRHSWQSYHPVIRVDVFFEQDSDRLHILELNTADPSAYAWSDFMLEGLYSSRLFSNFADTQQYTSDLMTANHLKMALHRYQEHCRALNVCPQESPKIALSIAKQSTVYFDFVALEQIYRKLGADVVLVEPGDFKWDRATNQIFAKDERIDIIVRDTLDEVYFPEGGVVHGDLPAILTQSDVCVVNPTASTLGDQKIWLAHLWQTLQSTATKSAAETLLADALPETWTVTSKNMEQLQQNKDHWVLKPSFGFGGHGVVVGLQMSKVDWQRHLSEIVGSPVAYIAQKHCAPMSGFMYPKLNGEIQHEPTQRCAVFSFWLFEGEFKGAFVRMSHNPIINTHQGGALVPVVWTP